ncbi:hypothetical protein HETIRDRAFT_469935 [Heterobasidion irregulare TC 32-1]|uniref:Uncharacterized protein n=1 Tax=Heterobasidion irregulare (strain TC 32-1) TaxID=747525 RepID=W4KPR9_HETIT|nr:uncharacterized protein HETIRDRAFT_469935 [Heterobasidion irregulare TC 32-1]ETW87714.1 hypothetical protein HETIRDRAFT_469935 [Heterobasidion irregulare TC 32-1]
MDARMHGDIMSEGNLTETIVDPSSRSSNQDHAGFACRRCTCRSLTDVLSVMSSTLGPRWLISTCRTSPGASLLRRSPRA